MSGDHTPDAPALLRALAAAPLTLASTFLFLLVFGPLPEEMGWRGYALDPLQAAYGPLTAALLLGVVHALWHLPLFFIEGSFQDKLGVFTPGFWRFMVSIVAMSVIISWAFNLTSRSTLLAVLLHWTENVSGELFDLQETAQWWRSGLYILLAATFVIITKGRLGT